MAPGKGNLPAANDAAFEQFTNYLSTTQRNETCISRQDGQQTTGGSDAEASASHQGRHASPHAMDHQSQETRAYWQFRKCVKLHNIAGDTEAEIWQSLQDLSLIHI